MGADLETRELRLGVACGADRRSAPGAYCLAARDLARLCRRAVQGSAARARARAAGALVHFADLPRTKGLSRRGAALFGGRESDLSFASDRSRAAAAGR